jgi:UDP-N-acetyl-2-amino-2-deoxyglucuronate dehydrogenase
MMAPIRFVVLGYGHIGKRHAAMITRHPEAQLEAIIDVKQAEDKAGAPWYCSLQAWQEAGGTADVCVVATPNGWHYAHTLAALEAGCHVVVEKPVGLRTAEVQHMLELAEVKGKQVFPVMQNRYSPPAVWIKQIIDSKRLGKLFMVQLNCFWNRDARYYVAESWHGDKWLDGGTLFTQFSHFIDMMYWLCGDVYDIKGQMFDFNHQHLTQFEDSGMLQFLFKQGGAGCLQFSTSVFNRNFESSITLIGENGTVKLGGQYMEAVTYCDIAGYEMPKLEPTNPGNDYGAYKGSAANHHFVIANVIDVLRGRAKITTRPEEGLAVVNIIERMYEACQFTK